MSTLSRYVNNLMADGTSLSRSVWASVADKFFNKITPEEIIKNWELQRSSFSDRLSICHANPWLASGGLHCSVLQDSLFVDTIDLRTQSTDGPTFNICFTKAGQTLVAVMGIEGASGGHLNKKVFDMRDSMI
uniref:Uncharacterized protein n=1 Tax=Erpetoichthys calabaricus TaxID=27687 RepID=A0A8C4RBF2_ERPCA